MEITNETIWGTYLFYVKKKSAKKSGKGSRMKACAPNMKEAKIKMEKWLDKQYGKGNYILTTDESYGLIKV